MGPKKKGNGKKGKEKRGEQPKPLRSQYLARIAQMNAVLAHIRENTIEIENVYFATNKTYEEIQEDLADVVKYLEHEIKVCDDDIATYDLGIEKYTKQMQKDKKEYERIFAQMDEEFGLKQRQITEKIQAVNAKLNSFEEMRRQREDFVKSKEILADMVAEMNVRHTQETYEAEKQAIIEQDKLQKEMESRLETLALNFREATDVRIGETTNRIIGENIKLGNSLTCHQDLLAKVRSKFTNLKKTQKLAILDLELKEGEYNITFEKYSDHAEEIKVLLHMVEESTKKITDLKKLIKINRRLKRRILEMECFNKDLLEEHVTLEKALNEIVEQTTNAKRHLQYFQRMISRLEAILFETAKRVKDAIECENALEKTEETTYAPGEEDTEVTGNTSELNEGKEIIYKKREAMIEEALAILQSGLLHGDELHLTASSIESYDTSFSYRSSLDLSPSSKRSEMGATTDHEETKIFENI